MRHRRRCGAMFCARFVSCASEAFRVRVLFPHQSGIDIAALAALEEKARHAIAKSAETVLGFDATSLPIEVEIGTPHSGILMTVDRIGAGLIVTGAGSTALRVARSAAAPVLIARPTPPRGGVLAATDFVVVRPGATWKESPTRDSTKSATRADSRIPSRQPRHAALDHAPPESRHIDGSDPALRT